MTGTNEIKKIWILSDQEELTAFLREDLATDSVHVTAYPLSRLEDVKTDIRHDQPDLLISCYHRVEEIIPLANREKIPLMLLAESLDKSVLRAFDHFPVVGILKMTEPFRSVRPRVSEFFNDQANHAKSRLLCVLPDESEQVLFRNISSIHKYGTMITGSCKKAEELLQAKPFDLIIVNVDHTDEKVNDFLYAVRNRDGNIPMLALSSRDRRVMLHKLYELGVNDCVHIPYTIDELNLKIAGLLRTVLSMKAIKKLSEVDYLTQILNRRSFYDQIQPYINLSRRQNLPFSIIMADIDHFKRVNDNYGHDMGDKILVESARVMRNNLRNYDILARFGGEEFVIFISNVNEINAMYVAEKLRKGFKSAFEDRFDHPVTMSLGVSTWSGGEVDVDELIQHADKALYVSKNSGRNRVTHFRNLL